MHMLSTLTTLRLKTLKTFTHILKYSFFAYSYPIFDLLHIVLCKAYYLLHIVLCKCYANAFLHPFFCRFCSCSCLLVSLHLFKAVFALCLRVMAWVDKMPALCAFVALRLVLGLLLFLIVPVLACVFWLVVVCLFCIIPFKPLYLAFACVLLSILISCKAFAFRSF